MSDENELGDALIRFVKNHGRGFIVTDAVVDSVDESKFVANVKLGESVFHEVPLRVLESDRASVIEIPEVNTPCIICFRDGNIQRPQMLWVHKVSKLLINCGNVIFNDGQLGGLVKVKDLTTKLNNLENKVNDFISTFNSHTHNVTAVGAPTGPSVPQGPNPLQPTQQAEIENLKIKQ